MQKELASFPLKLPGGIFQPLHEGRATGFLVPQKHEGLLLTRDGLPRFARVALFGLFGSLQVGAKLLMWLL